MNGFRVVPGGYWPGDLTQLPARTVVCEAASLAEGCHQPSHHIVLTMLRKLVRKPINEYGLGFSLTVCHSGTPSPPVAGVNSEGKIAMNFSQILTDFSCECILLCEGWCVWIRLRNICTLYVCVCLFACVLCYVCLRQGVRQRRILCKYVWTLAHFIEE